MNIKRVLQFLSNKEYWLHIVIWTLFLLSINVKWSESWIAESFLPEAVAPHLALAVAIIFIANVFWLIPRYLNKKNWYHYIWLSLSLLIGFELIRTLLFSVILQGENSFIETFKMELFGENSLIFGFLNILIFYAIFYSFVYRFARDWLINKSIIERLKLEKQQLEFNSLQIAGAQQISASDLSITETNPNRVNKKCTKKTLSVKKRDGIFILKVKDIVLFQAQGDFVFAYDIFDKRHIINESLKTVKEQICQDSFFQINRSELVNFNYINKFNSHTKNRLEIYLYHFSDSVYTSNSRTPEFRLWVEQQ